MLLAPRNSFFIELAETSPLSKELGVGDLDQVDLVPVPVRQLLPFSNSAREDVLGAESLDELDVLGLSAGLVENAEVSLALVESLGALAESTRKTVVDEGLLEDVLAYVPSSAPSFPWPEWKELTWRASSTLIFPLGASASATSATTSSSTSATGAEVSKSTSDILTCVCVERAAGGRRREGRTRRKN